MVSKLRQALGEIEKKLSGTKILGLISEKLIFLKFKYARNKSHHTYQ